MGDKASEESGAEERDLSVPLVLCVVVALILVWRAEELSLALLVSALAWLGTWESDAFYVRAARNAVRNVSLPIMLGLLVVAAALTALNLADLSTFGQQQVYAFQDRLVEWREAYRHVVEPTPPWSIVLATAVLVLSGLVPEMDLYNRFLVVQKSAQFAYIVALAVTSFFIGGLVTVEHQIEPTAHARLVARFQASLDRERRAAAQYAAATALSQTLRPTQTYGRQLGDEKKEYDSGRVGQAVITALVDQTADAAAENEGFRQWLGGAIPASRPSPESRAIGRLPATEQEWKADLSARDREESAARKSEAEGKKAQDTVRHYVAGVLSATIGQKIPESLPFINMIVGVADDELSEQLVGKTQATSSGDPAEEPAESRIPSRGASPSWLRKLRLPEGLTKRFVLPPRWRLPRPEGKDIHIVRVKIRDAFTRVELRNLDDRGFTALDTSGQQRIHDIIVESTGIGRFWERGG